MALPPAQALNKSTVLITGGTSGIGLGAALAFAGAGVPRIVLNGRNAERADAARRAVLVHAPSVEVLVVTADVTTVAGTGKVRDAVLNAFDTVDVLVNCAGGDHAPELFHALPIESLQTILTHYMMGALNVSHAILPTMMAQQRGSIINIASDAGKVPTPGTCINGAAMAGVAMFSRTLAIEGKRSGIRVNAVTPSIVGNTRTFDHVMSEGFSAKLFRKAMDAAVLGVVTPDDIAPLIVFLASPAAARITGQVISVNGGISAG